MSWSFFSSAASSCAIFSAGRDILRELAEWRGQSERDLQAEEGSRVDVKWGGGRAGQDRRWRAVGGKRLKIIRTLITSIVTLSKFNN